MGRPDRILGHHFPSADEVPEPVLNEREREKRRCIENSTSTCRKAPLLVLKSHIGRVSKALFGCEDGKAASYGFDSTVRLWNTERGVCEHTIVSCPPIPPRTHEYTSDP